MANIIVPPDYIVRRYRELAARLYGDATPLMSSAASETARLLLEAWCEGVTYGRTESPPETVGLG
jgi:hypothetical protein